MNLDESDVNVLQVLKTLDARTLRIEQKLPTLVTHEELRAAIEPLATREELRAAIAPLATREELRIATAPLATREEMREAIQASAEEGKRHTTVLFESLRDDIRLLAEHVMPLSNRPRR